MAERYTPFYEWMAAYAELDLPEALVLSRIKMWGNGGCWESYERLAQALKLHRGTVIRVVKRLLKKNLILVSRDSKQKRKLTFNFARFMNMPLLERPEGSSAALPVSSNNSANNGLLEDAERSSAALPASSAAPPEVVAQRYPTNVYSQDNYKTVVVEETMEKICEIMTRHEGQGRSRTETQQRRRMLQGQVDAMRK